MLLGVVQAAPEGARRLRDQCAEYDAFRKSPRARRPHPAIPEGLLADHQQIASRRDADDGETPGFVFDDVYHLAFDRVGAHDEREFRTTAGLPPGSDRRADSYCDFYDLRQLASPVRSARVESRSR